jgi:hypothetical protein
MRNFDVSGLNRDALEQAYEIVLTQKVILESKIDRLKKELATGTCAIRDGVVDQEEAVKGLENLIYYCESKVALEEELDEQKGTIDLVNSHIELVKEFAISKRAEKKPIKKAHVVYTDLKFALTPANVFCSQRKYLSEKEFLSQNPKRKLETLGMILDEKEFKESQFINQD